ncbi:esterase/lipase family protein [Paraconexibacter sp.]|uniref:esterase/lipase family protein n=1 Tax=Paraconexibacter sp. TaxID=2949640 RepID=UPI0035645A16
MPSLPVPHDAAGPLARRPAPEITRQQELKAVGDLGAYVVESFTDRVEELHHAISTRSFDATGPLGQPVRTVHDVVSSAIYGSVRVAGGAAARGVAAAVARLTPEHAEPISDTPSGSVARSAINGLLGDLLEAQESPLAIPLAARLAGRDVPPTPERLRDAYPQATPRLAIYVHGLGENESVWWWRARKAGHGPVVPMSERLHADLGFTGVHVRYNTGLRISENGARLATLLHALTEAWPVEVREVAIIGHSMGGLVARAAVRAGERGGHPWVQCVEHVVGLGTPHHGAPLEKGVNLAAFALRSVPEAAPIASVLDTRSVGIKDLAFGVIAEEHWRDRDGGALLKDYREAIELPDHISLHAVAATLAYDPRHAISSAFGDILVRIDSASGDHAGQGLGIRQEHRAHVGGLTHFDLPSDPQVYHHVREWLADDHDRARFTEHRRQRETTRRRRLRERFGYASRGSRNA